MSRTRAARLSRCPDSGQREAELQRLATQLEEAEQERVEAGRQLLTAYFGVPPQDRPQFTTTFDTHVTADQQADVRQALSFLGTLTDGRAHAGTRFDIAFRGTTDDRSYHPLEGH